MYPSFELAPNKDTIAFSRLVFLLSVLRYSTYRSLPMLAGGGCGAESEIELEAWYLHLLLIQDLM